MAFAPMSVVASSNFILFLVMFPTLGAITETECPELNCSPHGPRIRFPFRLKGIHPVHCGYPGFDLFCTTTNDTVLQLQAASVKLVVSQIDYKSQTIHVSDPDGCLPKYLRNLNLSASPFQFGDEDLVNLTLFSCSRVLPRIWSERYISCLNNDPNHLICALYSHYSVFSAPSLVSCTKLYNVYFVPSNMLNPKEHIMLGWSTPDCRNCEAEENLCKLKENSSESETECVIKTKQHRGASVKMKVTGAALSLFLCGLGIAAFYVHRSDKAEKGNQRRIKRFLENYRALKPTRYTYSDIKKITNQFKEQLGRGAYGTVYKGKVSNEILVAVKVLDNSIGNGEEFINEVGTMGRIHHVNVVRLVGYCADGFRRALVYEYLAKNSLQKLLSSANTRNHLLGWNKLQDIVLGIAKGIEYLHQGCDKRILHFDIKPHNILLDDNLNPKISDFGMAKLCSKDQSAVSMTAARGTRGYIAPEVFSRNFGNVSHKSDVYSFGMLVLEMVGGKNVEVTAAENDCRVYFPEWIYNLLEQGEELRIHIEEEEDANIAKKLAIVGLWCIQWCPLDRPSMKQAVQMLQGGEDLTIPPNPFASTSTKRNYAAPGRCPFQKLQVISEVE